MVTVGGSVLLADQYPASRHVSIDDFPDRTGYECFVNHFQFPYDGTRRALLHLIGRIAGIRRSLTEYAPDKSFLIIVSIAEHECTVRFHERRRAEAWLADDLEGYAQEAVAAIDVGRAIDCEPGTAEAG
jgi:hypothetical protein